MRAEGAGARKDCGRLLALTRVTGLRAIARCPRNGLWPRLGDGPLLRLVASYLACDPLDATVADLVRVAGRRWNEHLQ